MKVQSFAHLVQFQYRFLELIREVIEYYIT